MINIVEEKVFLPNWLIRYGTIIIFILAIIGFVIVNSYKITESAECKIVFSGSNALVIIEKNLARYFNKDQTITLTIKDFNLPGTQVSGIIESWSITNDSSRLKIALKKINKSIVSPMRTSHSAILNIKVSLLDKAKHEFNQDT